MFSALFYIFALQNLQAVNAVFSSANVDRINAYHFHTYYFHHDNQSMQEAWNMR